MLKYELKNAIVSFFGMGEDEAARVVVERPRFSLRGDFATNAAFVASPKKDEDAFGRAEQLAAHLRKFPFVVDAQVAGSGFVNITVPDFLLERDIGAAEEGFHKGFSFVDKSVNLEFISVNPTGPLHVGNGRGAFYGDILARLLSCAGARVTREFYINDSKEGAQIKELGKMILGKGHAYPSRLALEARASLASRSFSNEVEAGYAAALFIQEKNKEFITKTLGIRIDTWFSEENDLRQKKKGEELLRFLKTKGVVYEKDQALWLRTKDFGDTEDRVLKRSDGTFSYFAHDIAYHQDKFLRGYDTLIDIWGADHHGHVKRMQAASRIMGWQGELIILIAQMVVLKEKGQKKKMSKRAGTAIELAELVEQIGLDATRWFFAEKSLGTHMELDIDLARDKSEKNPVYYVQYTHARACSLLRKKGKEPRSPKQWQQEERRLLLVLSECIEVVQSAAEEKSVHIIPSYAHRLSQAFNQFYQSHRVVGHEREAARLFLVEKTQSLLGGMLRIMGITAPVSM